LKDVPFGRVRSRLEGCNDLFIGILFANLGEHILDCSRVVREVLDQLGPVHKTAVLHSPFNALKSFESIKDSIFIKSVEQ